MGSACGVAAMVVMGCWPAGIAGGTEMMMFADTDRGEPFAKDPAVVRFDGAYLMYYTMRADKGYGIGIARSEDLVQWTKMGEMAPEAEYESKGFCAPGALAIDGKVHLFYQSYGTGPLDAICHAWSEDGLTFTRDPTNPIVRPTGDWNAGRAIDADVIPFRNQLLLYWATRDPEMKVQMLGVSTAPLDSDFSRDTWTQRCDAPILKPELPWEKRCIEAPALCERDGRLWMFYAGAYNNEPQQIGLAVSDDGIAWTRVSDEPFLANGPERSWNSSESGHPYLFEDDDGRDYLFYQGNNDKGRTWYLSQVEIEWVDGRPRIVER